MSSMELSTWLSRQAHVTAFANFSLECSSASKGTGEILPDRPQVGLDMFCLGFFLSRYYVFIFLNFALSVFLENRKINADSNF